MPQADLKRARECYERREWGEACRLLTLADRASPLGAADLERLAIAALLIGRNADYREYLDRACGSHVAEGRPDRAARCAFWLGLTLMFAGDAVPANGWLTRAGRLIEAIDCAEHGFLLLPVVERQLEQDDLEAALETATAAANFGSRFDDPDLTVCARHLLGRVRLRQGKVQDGLGVLDELLITVGSRAVSPVAAGLIYCSVIDACREVFALDRARAWTMALARWCGEQPDLVAFTTTCSTHRAELLQHAGEWPEAMAEAGRACGRSPRPGAPAPPAGAFYRQGEIHRLRGDFAEAEAAYREASRLGGDPQPGLALLRLAQGRREAARAAMRRTLTTTTHPLQRARLLPAGVEIALASGDTPRARELAGELDLIATRCGTDVLRAMAADALGSVALAEGRPKEALQGARRAAPLWAAADVPHELARSRRLAGLACRDLGDFESAELEFQAARAGFEALGARPELAHLDALLDSPPGNAPVLTPRERQVLRQIAAGRTSKAIATKLEISPRTVDRHVSNICIKLGVSSRAAAIARASRQHLL